MRGAESIAWRQCSDNDWQSSTDARNDVDDEARRRARAESGRKWVVFSLVEPAYDEKDQVSDLWIVPADACAKPRRLTFSKGGESGVAWSPDSRRIAFSARREGDEVSQIYVLDVAEGGEAVRVTSLSTGARSPQWRPDGKAMLFVSTVYPGAADDEANKKIAAERKAQKYRARLREVSDSQLGQVDRRHAGASVRANRAARRESERSTRRNEAGQ